VLNAVVEAFNVHVLDRGFLPSLRAQDMLKTLKIA